MIIKEKIDKQIRKPVDIARILQEILMTEAELDQDKEHFWAIGFDCRMRIKYIELVSLGTLTTTLFHPRETFRLAIMKGVTSIMIAHNHPSGEMEFSDPDIECVKKLKQAGEILGIELMDALIISKYNYVSAKDTNII